MRQLVQDDVRLVQGRGLGFVEDVVAGGSSNPHATGTRPAAGRAHDDAAAAQRTDVLQERWKLDFPRECECAQTRLTAAPQDLEVERACGR